MFMYLMNLCSRDAIESEELAVRCDRRATGIANLCFEWLFVLADAHCVGVNFAVIFHQQLFDAVATNIRT